MALDPRFVYLAPLQEAILDKDSGLPLSAGIVTFYEDSDRSVFKDVYALTGSYTGGYTYVNIGHEITLTSIGTFCDTSGNDIIPMLFPFQGAPDASNGNVDLYYITVYAAAPPVGSGALQFTRQAWPNTFGSQGTGSTFSDTANALSNPQFSQVNFTPIPTTGVVINVTGSNTLTAIAPDWSLLTNGTGTVTVNQIAIASVSPSNPDYAIQILASTGISSLQLSQTLTNTPRIFVGEYVSATFGAASIDGIAHSLTMNYVSSLTGTPQALVSGITNIANTFQQFTNVVGSVLIASPGAGAAPANVAVNITIPIGAAVSITNVQMVGVPTMGTSVSYLEQPVARDIDQLFHYYKPKLDFKPIKSLLTGWDFALNPAQFGNVNIVNTSTKYIWDQTIGLSAVGSCTVAAQAATDVLTVTTTNANEAFYLLQYLQGAEALKTTFSNLSVNLNAYSQTNPGVAITVGLYYSSASGAIPALPTGLGSIAYNAGVPVFTLTTAGWTAVPVFPGYPTSATLLQNTSKDYGFPSFNGLANFGSASATDNFAIVVSFAVPTSGTTVVINSISCVPGDIPTRPAPLTSIETLFDCQTYYETNFQPGSFIAANNPSIISVIQSAFGSGGTITMGAANFSLQYKAMARVTNPNLTFYSRAAGANVVQAVITSNSAGGTTNAADIAAPGQGGSPWNILFSGNYGMTAVPNTASGQVSVTATTNTPNGYILYNYIKDARLGVV